MKNNFVATFVLLVAGLVILGGCKGGNVEQANSEGIEAVNKCYGNKDEQECNKARRIMRASINSCAAGDPAACKLASDLKQADSEMERAASGMTQTELDIVKAQLKAQSEVTKARAAKKIADQITGLSGSPSNDICLHQPWREDCQ